MSSPFNPDEYSIFSCPFSTLHCIHLISHVSYLFCLAHIILYPPSVLSSNSPAHTVTPYIVWIILYGVCNIVFDFTFFSVFCHGVVILSVLSEYRPDSLGPIALLIMFSIHIIRMHLRGYPTHLLLFEPKQFLPISTFFTECFKRCLIPSLIFLLPMIFTFLVLLSLSLSDAIPPYFGESVMNASPLSVRTGFLIFLTTSIFLLVCLAGALIVHFPNVSHGTLESVQWGKFGIECGVIARRFFIRTIIKYSTFGDETLSLIYPPPFNIVGCFLNSLSKKLIPQLNIKSWYLMVGPVAFLTAGIWLWGLLT